MKARTLIYLEPDQLLALRALARSQSTSLAELLRRIVQRHLDSLASQDPPHPDAYLRLVGLGASGRSDVSERHDDYFAEAIADEHHG